MTDIAARIAAAAGDPAALLVLAIELAQENAQLLERASATDRRRKLDADRKRSRRSSADIGGQPQTSDDVGGPFPPSPSLLPPTPPNNSSSAPHPASSPRASEEQRLYDRAPEVEPVAIRFLDGKLDTARAAWIGRFHGAMDRPPHASGRELTDAIEDLMTKPREDWVPALFRQFVNRIRRDAVTDAERAANPTVRSFGRSSVNAQEFAAAAADWDLIKGNNLLTSWPAAELYAIGDTLVSAGRFPSRDAFLGWYRLIKPAELREARTDRWAVEQIVERRGARQAVAS